ncbi:baseplate J/gp47 family protein [Xanthomonas albilineans]|uniref:baseplate J/gp47 family protein n=1 Tax=Xanthomonas albilineans TaxID=29447 RepID=UPI0005F33D9F|nr:baseplate J/gp47 family protein [Xanthomonas albilineans]
MFNRPSLSDLINRTTNDVFQRLQQDNVLRRADAQVYARVLAGVAHGLYGFIEWISRQIIIDTAEAEFLERWASIWRVQRLAATPATGTITFTLAPNAADIPVGTLVQTLDGTQFQTTADITVSGFQATTSVTAVAPSAASNNYAGQTANLVTPVLGVQTTAVLDALSGGGDRELDDSLRERLLNRIQKPPQGGDANDYVQWTLAAPGGGATRAWVVPEQFGEGTVGVAFVCDGNGASAAILPSTAQIAAVATYIDTVRPVTAHVTVYAPLAVPINFAIAGLSPNTLAVQQAVVAELADLLAREGQPGGTILLSHMRSAISSASQEWDYVLLTPTTNVVLPSGQIPVIGKVVWQ